MTPFTKPRTTTNREELTALLNTCTELATTGAGGRFMRTSLTPGQVLGVAPWPTLILLSITNSGATHSFPLQISRRAYLEAIRRSHSATRTAGNPWEEVIALG